MRHDRVRGSQQADGGKEKGLGRRRRIVYPNQREDGSNTPAGSKCFATYYLQSGSLLFRVADRVLH
jgi:hypothetical protein